MLLRYHTIPWVFFIFICCLFSAMAVSAGPKEDALAKKKEADVRFAEGDIEGALRAYDESISLFEDPSALLAKASTLISLHRYDESLALYQRLLSEKKAGSEAGKVKKAIQSLEKIVRTSVVCTSTPEGASVYVDSRVEGPRGKTPVTLQLTPGKHRIIVEFGGYESQTRNITVKDGQSLPLAVALQATPAKVLWRSQPSGAAILVNGKELGKTPLESSLQPGSYEVKLQKDGYKLLQETVTVESAQSFLFDRVLALPDGELVLALSPKNAVAEIVGIEEPYKSGTHALPPGSYRVFVKARGFGEEVRDIEIKQSQRTELSVELFAKGGFFSLQDAPPDVLLRIDGQPKATLRSVLLSPGRHRIQVSAKGREPYEQSILVKAGEELALSVQLAEDTSREQQKRFVVAGSVLGAWMLCSITAIAMSASVKASLREGELDPGLQVPGKAIAVVADLSLLAVLPVSYWALNIKKKKSAAVLRVVEGP
jgi:hypothetical protein